MSKAIDSISFGENIEKEIRTNQSWSLLPLQAVFSSVMPGAFMRSTTGLGFPQFPQFMGKLSTTNKNNRLVDELKSHMLLSVPSSRNALIMDYLEPLRDSLINPLVELQQAGIPNVLEILRSYSLSKEDMDSVLELTQWAGDPDPMKKVDPKTKAALTRAYNKASFALPYATDNEVKAIVKRGKGSAKDNKLSKSAAKLLVSSTSGDEDEENDSQKSDLEEFVDFEY